MKNRIPFELKYQQLKKFESLKVTEKKKYRNLTGYSIQIQGSKVKLGTAEEDHSFFSRGNSKKISRYLQKLDTSHSYLIIIITIALNHFHMWNTKLRFTELLFK